MIASLFLEINMHEIPKKAALITAPFLVWAAQLGCTNPDATSQDQSLKNISSSQKTITPGVSKYILTYINKLTTGRMNTPNAPFFLPESNQVINPQLNSNRVEVLNPTGRNRFLVQTSRGMLEIPLDAVDIQGNLSWANRTLRLPWLGFDCTQPELINKIPEIGASSVRIPVEQADDKFFKDRPEVIEAIKAAKANRLKIMLLFNPTKLISEQETEKRLDKVFNILGDYKNVSFELGNEPDLEWFWKDANLDSFAQFIKLTSQILAKRSPHNKQIIGAIAHHDKIRPFLQTLKRNGVDPNRFIIGVHAYNGNAEVQEKIGILHSQLNPSTKLIFTEIGWNKSQDDKGKQVISMIEAGRKLGVEEYYIFQLRNIPFAGSDDPGLWGYVDPGGKWEKQIWNLVDYIWGKGTAR